MRLAWPSPRYARATNGEVLAILELPAVSVGAAVGRGHGQACAVLIHGERVAVGQFGRDEEWLLVARTDEARISSSLDSVSLLLTNNRADFASSAYRVLMLPNSNHRPSGSRETPVGIQIAPAVIFDLGFPES